MNAPQDLLKQYVQSQHFTSTADIMAAISALIPPWTISPPTGCSRTEKSGLSSTLTANAGIRKPSQTALRSTRMVLPSVRKASAWFPMVMTPPGVCSCGAVLTEKITVPNVQTAALPQNMAEWSKQSPNGISVFIPKSPAARMPTKKSITSALPRSVSTTAF